MVGLAHAFPGDQSLPCTPSGCSFPSIPRFMLSSMLRLPGRLLSVRSVKLRFHVSPNSVGGEEMLLFDNHLESLLRDPLTLPEAAEVFSLTVEL